MGIINCISFHLLAINANNLTEVGGGRGGRLSSAEEVADVPLDDRRLPHADLPDECDLDLLHVYGVKMSTFPV